MNLEYDKLAFRKALTAEHIDSIWMDSPVGSQIFRRENGETVFDVGRAMPLGGEPLLPNGRRPPMFVGDRAIRMVAVTEGFKRGGNYLEMNPILTNFMKNPIMVCQHDRERPMGSYSDPMIETIKAREVQKDGSTVEVEKKALTMTAHFASNTLGEEILGLFRDGHMSSFSIGLAATKYEVVDIENQEEWDFYVKFLEWELLECSPVSVPADPDANAIREFAASGRLSEETVAALSMSKAIELTASGKVFSIPGEDGEEMQGKNPEIEEALAGATLSAATRSKLQEVRNKLASAVDAIDQLVSVKEEATPEDEEEDLQDSYKPTEEMAEEAQRGLDWRRETGRGGTEVGVARARDIANRKNLSVDTIKRMNSYFARHEVDKKAEGFRPGEDGYPSAGRVAWALWGGDAGQQWARKIGDQIDSEEQESSNLDLSPLRETLASLGYKAKEPDLSSLLGKKYK